MATEGQKTLQPASYHSGFVSQNRSKRELPSLFWLAMGGREPLVCTDPFSGKTLARFGLCSLPKDR